MKKHIFFSVLVSASLGAAHAQEFQLESPKLEEKVEQPAMDLKVDVPNEVIGERVVYSGVLVQAGKTDNLLQLINPRAPMRYGRAEANVVRDPFDRRVRGISLLSIRF